MQLSGAIKATAFVHTRISWNTISHELIDGFVTERNEMTQVKCALTKRQITESMMAKIHDEIGNSRIPQPYSAHRKCTLKAQSPWVRVQLKDIANYLGYTSSSVFGRAVLRRRRSWEKWEAGLRRRPLLYPLAPRPAGRERLSRSDNLGGKLVEALRTDSVFDLWEIRWPTFSSIQQGIVSPWNYLPRFARLLLRTRTDERKWSYFIHPFEISNSFAPAF